MDLSVSLSRDGTERLKSLNGLERSWRNNDDSWMTDPISTNATLARRDLKHLWHPCTQMHDHETVPMVPIVRGDGAWLIDADGRRYLDGISWGWNNLLCHANR